MITASPFPTEPGCLSHFGAPQNQFHFEFHDITRSHLRISEPKILGCRGGRLYR